MTAGVAKISFPKIRKVSIRSLSIYSRRPIISLDIPDGVFCLAGANGLGKSTFVAAINFGLTGRVPEPDRSFRSVEEYYDVTEPFSKNYYSGRVKESDRDSAEIELTFDVGQYTYRIVKGLFVTNSFRLLEITDGNNVSQQEDVGIPSTNLLESYALSLPLHMGLTNFQQFVFLQHFLQTFDERRSLTFWQPLVLQELLFLAFGGKPDLAHESDQERRRAERLESNARNLNYQATETRKRLRDVEKALLGQQSIEDDIRIQHEQLERRRDELKEQLDFKGGAVQDRRLRIDGIGADLTSLRRQYEEVFAERIVQQHGIEYHPLIVQSLAESQCNLCGSSEHFDELGNRVRGETCPLCGRNLSLHTSQSQESLDRLKILDTGIRNSQEGLDSESLALRRLEEEWTVLNYQLAEVSQQIAEMEADNVKLLANTQSAGDSDLVELAETHRQEILELIKSRDEHRLRRDEHLRKFRGLQAEIAQAYASAEEEFVPAFRSLAREFLGLDIDVRLISGTDRIGLVLEVEGQTRRLMHELSESQRFFLDIALRMSLGNFMADSSAPITMYIDTAEGSLDIAYESRAGRMFAQFVQAGSHIMMTANINTSQILLRLASLCGNEKMRLGRMTDWTQLSDVQRESESLFDEAYESIESNLAPNYQP